jgi:hypothetical protein
VRKCFIQKVFSVVIKMKWSAFLLEKDPLVGLRIAGDVQVNDAINFFFDEGKGSAGRFWEPITK